MQSRSMSFDHLEPRKPAVDWNQRLRNAYVNIVFVNLRFARDQDVEGRIWNKHHKIIERYRSILNQVRKCKIVAFTEIVQDLTQGSSSGKRMERRSLSSCESSKARSSISSNRLPVFTAPLFKDWFHISGCLSWIG